MNDSSVRYDCIDFGELVAKLNANFYLEKACWKKKILI